MKLFDFLMKPSPLPYDFKEWEKLPFQERTKKVCQAWAMQGFGAPISAPLFYILKVALYILGWMLCCSMSENLGSISDIGLWWNQPEALYKAICWTSLIEVCGLGGASGPLGARYVPPFGGMTYFLRPKTIKIPAFPQLSIFKSDTRNIIDVLLYAGLLGSLLYACFASQLNSGHILPIVILLPVLGILDRQIYLAARADMYFPALVVLLFPMDSFNALKILWVAVWFWAAFSKLQPSFPSVVSVMICNSPFLKFPWLKKRLFKKYPSDLRLSSTVNWIAHFGTVVEFSLPLIILYGTWTGWDSASLYPALLGMTLFHIFIFMNIPMGVPMEWNVIMAYGAWVLFYGTEGGLVITALPIISIFILFLLIMPILGNLFPRHISFLLSMRYYAGTWPYSIWLFKKGKKIEKLEPNIVKTSADLRKQLSYFYDEETANSMLSKVIAFRFMHLPGRLLHELIPKAVKNIDDYLWQDGEFIAGEVGGWNFGDAHLSSERMLASVQKRCHFETGELRVIMVESPQLHNGKLHWRIHDAKDGLLEEGFGNIWELKKRLP